MDDFCVLMLVQVLSPPTFPPSVGMRKCLFASCSILNACLLLLTAVTPITWVSRVRASSTLLPNTGDGSDSRFSSSESLRKKAARTGRFVMKRDAAWSGRKSTQPMMAVPLQPHLTGDTHKINAWVFFLQPQ